MAQTNPGTLQGSAGTLVRSVSGTPVAAESTTINDTNFPPANDTACYGWQTVKLVPKLTGGSSPTVTIQVLERVASSTSFWSLGETSVPLSDGQSYELEVGGREVFFRLAAVTGSPTQVDLHCGGGEPLLYGGAAKR